MSERLTDLNVSELRKRLKAKGLSTSGKKAELVKRLQQSSKRKGKKASVSPVRCTTTRKGIYYFDPDTGKRVSKTEAQERGMQACIPASERRKERKKTPKRMAEKLTRLPLPPAPVPGSELERIVKEPKYAEPKPSLELRPPSESLTLEPIYEEIPVEVSATPSPSLSLSLTDIDEGVRESLTELSESVGEDEFSVVRAYYDPDYKMPIPVEVVGTEGLEISDETFNQLYEKYNLNPSYQKILLVPTRLVDELFEAVERFSVAETIEQQNERAEELYLALARYAVFYTKFVAYKAYYYEALDLYVPFEKIGSVTVLNLDDIGAKIYSNPLKTRDFVMLIEPQFVEEAIDLANRFYEAGTEGEEARIAQELKDIDLPVVKPVYSIFDYDVLVDENDRKDPFLGQEVIFQEEDLEEALEKYGGKTLLFVPASYGGLVEVLKTNILESSEKELYQKELEDLINKRGVIFSY
jgi:hypothetical protein